MPAVSDRGGSGGGGWGRGSRRHGLAPPGPRRPLRAGIEQHGRGGGGGERGLGGPARPAQLPAGHPAPEQVRGRGRGRGRGGWGQGRGDIPRGGRAARAERRHQPGCVALGPCPACGNRQKASLTCLESVEKQHFSYSVLDARGITPLIKCARDLHFLVFITYTYCIIISFYYLVLST